MDLQKKRIYRFNDARGLYHARARFLDFHFMSPSGAFEYPAHRHEVHEAIIVLEGPYRCSLNGVELRVDPGCVLVIEPGDVHQDHLARRQRHYVLHFSFQPGGLLLFSPDTPMRDRICAEGNWDASSFCRWMETESSVTGSNVELPDARARIQDALMDAFFWELARHYPKESLSPEFRDETARQFFVSRLYRAFADHCRSDFSVDDMAEEMRVSRRALTENCARWLDVSPARAFLSFRIEAASRELKSSGKTVREVSDFFGFDNPFQFSRAFKRIFGAAPVSFKS